MKRSYNLTPERKVFKLSAAKTVADELLQPQKTEKGWSNICLPLDFNANWYIFIR